MRRWRPMTADVMAIHSDSVPVDVLLEPMVHLP